MGSTSSIFAGILAILPSCDVCLVHVAIAAVSD